MNPRLLMSLICVAAFALVAPALVMACGCPFGCNGTYCYCNCNVCSDNELTKYPCPQQQAVAFTAGRDELSAFKRQIDLWSTRADLSQVVEAATEVYNAVLFRDSQKFSEANDRFNKAVSALPEQIRLSLTLWSEAGQKPEK
jgi:hypothetical protein